MTVVAANVNTLWSRYNDKKARFLADIYMDTLQHYSVSCVAVHWWGLRHNGSRHDDLSHNYLIAKYWKCPISALEAKQRMTSVGTLDT